MRVPNTMSRNQVAPAELEDTLQSHEDVVEAGVTFTWDANQQTEIPIAYVVLKPTVAVADREKVLAVIHKWHDSRVSPYKKIRGGLHYIEALPKNATGKLVRAQLPARLEAVRQAAAASRPAKL